MKVLPITDDKELRLRDGDDRAFDVIILWIYDASPVAEQLIRLCKNK